MIRKTLILHEFAVVRQFSLNGLIGVDILQQNHSSLRYLNDKQNEFKFCLQSCFNCDYNRSILCPRKVTLMRYIDRVLHDSRNRVQAIATLSRYFRLRLAQMDVPSKACRTLGFATKPRWPGNRNSQCARLLS